MKMDDGTVYGPADLNRLQAWAREGRVEPSSQISSDRKSWTPAPLMPELGREWIVEVETGGYYGPFHPDVIRDLIAKNRIPASARRFRLDTGREQEDHSKELNAALEKAKAAAAEKDAALVERESALAKAKALLAEKDASLAEQKSSVAGKEASIAELKAALVEQKTLIAGLRNQEVGLAAKLEKSLKESKSATAASASRVDELEVALKAERAHAEELGAALAKSKSETEASLAHVEELGAALESARSEVATERTRYEELSAALKESKSVVAASASRVEELETALKAEHSHVDELETALKAERVHGEKLETVFKEALARANEQTKALNAAQSEAKAEHVRVENLLAQLVTAAEREKALRADLDLAHKTAASGRKCVEAAIRRERQTAKELEGARKDAEDLRVKMQKAKTQSKATKGKGGLFQGASAAELAFLEQAARRELASARGRSASVPRPQPKALDVIDV